MQPGDQEQMDEDEKRPMTIGQKIAWVIFNLILLGFFIGATVIFITYDKKAKCKLDESEGNDTSNGTTTPMPPQCYGMNWCHGYGFLLILITIFYFFFIYYMFFKPLIGIKIAEKYLDPAVEKWMVFSRKLIISLILFLLVVAFICCLCVWESRKDMRKLFGLCGPLCFIALGFAISKHRRLIKWRIVITGIFLQFLLGFLLLRWSVGRRILKCAGDKVATFLGYSGEGARFVYGERIYQDFVFAFIILAVIFFFSVVSSILYFLGAMQAVLRVAGWLLQATMGTTVCESVNAAGNVFLGQSESPLMIRPYIAVLTASEIHAVMSAGFATVAGTVLGAYISFGASPSYLITASLMAAPAALALSKLIYPESEESETTSDNIRLEKSADNSVLDAAVSGASNGMQIALGIVASIIAFLAILAFLNALVEWLFELIGIMDCQFLTILTYAFMPLAFVMGVPWHDCSKIAKVVATKTAINEFVAYVELGRMMREEEVEQRSAGIATFALCGFANPGSLGILISALCIMAPAKRNVITSVALRAFLTGSLVTFTSASWAGIFIDQKELEKLGKGLLDVEDLDYNDMGPYLLNV